MLRSFGLMETTEDDRLVKRIIGFDVRGVRLGVSPRTAWMDDEKSVE